MNKLVKLLKAVGITMIILAIVVGIAFGIDILVNWLTSINPYFTLIPLGVVVFAFFILLTYDSL